MGQSYPFTVKTSKTSLTQSAAIWCDLNDDKDFDDAGELLYTSAILDTTFTGSISIPEGLSVGVKRFRIRTVRNNLLGAGNSCTFYNTGGEIEDYQINIDVVAGVGPIVVRQPNSAGISIAGNSTYTVRWAKGATAFTTVKIKLSADGGLTYPYTLAENISNTLLENTTNITMPGIITTQARIRVANQSDSTDGDVSDNNFTITGYCWPWGMSCTNNSINNFTLNTISRASGCGNVRAYTVVNASGAGTTTMQRGISYPFTINTSVANPNMAVGIWCDFNGDLDFDDAGEFLYGSPSFGTSFSGNITIPGTTATGQRRLRVRTVRGTLLTASNACTFFNSGGEIEDYTVTIDQPTITITSPTPDICSGTALSVAFTTTGTFLPGNTFQVQISASNGVFGGGTSIIGSGSTSPISCFLSIGAPAGSYRIRVVSSTPIPAVFGTNSAYFNVFGKPAKPTSSSVARCGPGTVTLTASGCSTMQWFDAALQGNLAGSGTSFVTPSLASSKTYYVACIDGQGCQSLRTPSTAVITPLPTISLFAPTSGTVDLTTVVIAGSGFTNLDSVVFSGNKKATILSSAASSINVKVPIGATTGPITVYTRCGSVASSSSFTPIVPTIATPTSSLPSGTYPTSTTTTLSCATSGASIYYTLNGNTPVPGTDFTLLYTGSPVFIGSSLTLKAIGFRNGWVTSGIAVESFIISAPTIVAAPVISPDSGTYVGGQLLTITCSTPQTTIYFTLNGQVPVPGVNTPIKYLGPIMLTQTSTVRAIAFRNGWQDSPVSVSHLIISGASSLSACTYSPPPGIYGVPQSVTISNPDPLASIYFTTDGTDPYKYFPLAKPYAGPVAINASAPLKASAYRDGFGDSPRTVGLYTIGAIRFATENLADAVYYTEEVGPANQKPDKAVKTILKSVGDMTVSLYPNPTNGNLSIDFGIEKENIQITILNVVGQVIQRSNTIGVSTGSVINLAGNSPGMYIVRITDQTGNFVDKKLVLQ